MWLKRKRYYGPQAKQNNTFYRNKHEKDRDKYNQRVIDTEKSSFNPFAYVFTSSTSGAMTPESTKYWIKNS